MGVRGVVRGVVRGGGGAEGRDVGCGGGGAVA